MQNLNWWAGSMTNMLEMKMAEVVTGLTLYHLSGILHVTHPFLAHHACLEFCMTFDVELTATSGHELPPTVCPCHSD